MSKVKVEFDYEPDEPDDDDPCGMSEEEFNRVMDAVIAIGGENIEFNAGRGGIQ